MPQLRRVLLVFMLLSVGALSIAQVPDGAHRRVARRVQPAVLPMSTPEEQGMDSIRLAEAVAYLNRHRRDYRPHQIIVVRHGRRVLDVALYPFSNGVRHDIASVGKMIVGTLIGIAIDQGFIASADEPVLSFFPDRQIANRDTRKEAMTIAHLLAQRSGIYHGDDGSHAAEDAAMRASPDWVQWILDRPMAEEPGGTWYYSGANLHLAAAVLAQATGMSPLEFARRYLYRPLDISSVRWEADPQGINIGSGSQQLLPLDLAKIGQLYLDGGVWEGRRVVSQEWIERATSPAPGPPPQGWPPDFSVGFHWVIADGYLEAGGSGGQLVQLYTDQDMVVVVVAGGGTPYQGCSNPAALADPLYAQYLGPAIRSSSALPANPAGTAALAAQVAAAAVSYEGPAQAVPTLPDTAWTISGRRFLTEPNPAAIQWFRLSFTTGDEATLEIIGLEQLNVLIGLDNVCRYFIGEDDLPAAARGWWADSSTFELLLDEYARFHNLDISIHFTGSSAAATITDLACPGGPSVTITGTME